MVLYYAVQHDGVLTTKRRRKGKRRREGKRGRGGERGREGERGKRKRGGERGGGRRGERQETEIILLSATLT